MHFVAFQVIFWTWINHYDFIILISNLRDSITTNFFSTMHSKQKKSKKSNNH